jgi:flavin reductase (DIM6/NTAB) family NADH-FMN oxidoreductase RutF
MGKISISNNAFIYPMPMTIISAVVDGKPNHLAAAWINRADANPPKIVVALGKSHHTNVGIREHGEFGVSIPHSGMAKEVDRIGIVSGKREDKSKAFEVFYGSLENAPLVSACRLNMSCRVIHRLELDVDELFVADIVEAWADEDCLTGGRPDVKKIDPFVLTMPDNGYWSVGEYIGGAWKIGKP